MENLFFCSLNGICSSVDEVTQKVDQRVLLTLEELKKRGLDRQRSSLLIGIPPSPYTKTDSAVTFLVPK
jgi:hypothetical protein